VSATAQVEVRMVHMDAIAAQAVRVIVDHGYLVHPDLAGGLERLSASYEGGPASRGRAKSTLVELASGEV